MFANTQMTPSKIGTEHAELEVLESPVGKNHNIRSDHNAAVNVNPVPPLVRRSTLGKKEVAQNSTLIQPGPQVNLSGIQFFSPIFHLV
jgi:hypothetical protein